MYATNNRSPMGLGRNRSRSRSRGRGNKRPLGETRQVEQTFSDSTRRSFSVIRKIVPTATMARIASISRSQSRLASQSMASGGVSGSMASVGGGEEGRKKPVFLSKMKRAEMTQQREQQQKLEERKKLREEQIARERFEKEGRDILHGNKIVIGNGISASGSAGTTGGSGSGGGGASVGGSGGTGGSGSIIPGSTQGMERETRASREQRVKERAVKKQEETREQELALIKKDYLGL